MKRYNNMLTAYNAVTSIIEKVEAKAVNNVTIAQLLTAKDVAILSANNINPNRTAKQTRRSMAAWFRSHEMPTYSIEVEERGQWIEAEYGDDKNLIMELAQLGLDNGYDVRIKNNVNGCLRYKQGANWIDFPKA